MSGAQNSANSGAHAILGFEFQRNCALYLILSEYSKFKDREFFLCIEHHDDFLFCYKSDCLSEIEEVSSYQIKKKSGSLWTINSEFDELITKILNVGFNLKEDSAKKSNNYKHDLIFISNTYINLTYKPKKEDEKKGKKIINLNINAENNRVKFNEIPAEIKNKINLRVKKFCEKSNITFYEDQLDNLNIQWVDFTETRSAQIQQLNGTMLSNFPHVSDSKAAVDILLELFRKIESVHNQKKIISLLDSSKRIEGREIKKVIDIIETKQKTFELWRKNSKDLCSKFDIPMLIQKNIEHEIGKSFELLKDMTNSEHQTIKGFVSNNDYEMEFSNYGDIFSKYLEKINANHSLQLTDIDIFFAILCSYVEHYDVSSI